VNIKRSIAVGFVSLISVFGLAGSSVAGAATFHPNHVQTVFLKDVCKAAKTVGGQVGTDLCGVAKKHPKLTVNAGKATCAELESTGDVQATAIDVATQLNSAGVPAFEAGEAGAVLVVASAVSLCTSQAGIVNQWLQSQPSSSNA
jgi:hypothetical protein